jgi:phage tail-like protein
VTRRELEGVTSRHPLAAALPAVLREDPHGEPGFVERFCGALDEVLAPIALTLDALEAYVDPRIAPRDFLRWLRRWPGLPEEIALSEAATRAFVLEAAELHRWWGTEWALRRWLELYTEGNVEVTDNGGSLVAGDASSAVRFDREPPWVRVRVRVPRVRARNADFQRGLRALVAAATPAHVVTRVEVTEA